MHLLVPVGIEIADGKFLPLFPKDATIPTSSSSIFGTAIDDQGFMDVHVLQGERPDAKDCATLGRYRLEDLPKGPKGHVQFQITFGISSTGLLNLQAMELITGYPIRITGPADRIVSIH
ncbi:MAG: Hsp70 family protein [Planctomycetes bacterium]|nr:Hsp70 family protein [Planctomycetota bacterium]